MEKLEIQEFARKNNLDIREVQDNHWRLLDEYGEFALDIYFKKNKKGKIVKNSTLNWKTEKWFYPTSINELQSIIKSSPMYNEIEEQENFINSI